MSKLSEEQIEHHLAQVEKWVRKDGKWIEKKYRFNEFLDGIEFVNQVAQIAESLNHHPFISIDYKMVTLKITSWHAGGLTELDFQCAHKFDQAVQKS